MKRQNWNWTDAVLAVEWAMAVVLMGAMGMLRAGWERVGRLARLAGRLATHGVHR